MIEPNRTSDDFGALLVKLVRDPAIRESAMLASGRARGPVGDRWRATGVDSSVLADVLIPDVVDETLFFLLSAIDNGDLQLHWTTDEREAPVPLTELGRWEMAGTYIGDDGWRAEFSAEARNDFSGQ